MLSLALCKYWQIRPRCIYRDCVIDSTKRSARSSRLPFLQDHLRNCRSGLCCTATSLIPRAVVSVVFFLSFTSILHLLSFAFFTNSSGSAFPRKRARFNHRVVFPYWHPILYLFLLLCFQLSTKTATTSCVRFTCVPRSVAYVCVGMSVCLCVGVRFAFLFCCE